MKKILKMKNVSYSYGTRDGYVEILSNINYEFETGKLYVIMGKSGIGKTTTLSLLGALDVPAEGEIFFQNEDLNSIGYNEYRKKNVGIIFQDFNLLEYLNVLQNVILVYDIAGKGNKAENAKAVLNKVGIREDKFSSNVLKLSGGEKQRVAIARAIASDAEIILADEPTGNLDSETSREVVDILLDLAHVEEKCVIVVTHSQEIAERGDVLLELKERNLYPRTKLFHR